MAQHLFYSLFGPQFSMLETGEGFNSLINRTSSAVKEKKLDCQDYIQVALPMMGDTDTVNTIINSWILIDCKKLSSTLFVIKKKDEVVSGDEEEYKLMEEIKIKNVKDKLHERIGITIEELKELKIVCISANPDGKSHFSEWSSRIDEYRIRSHMSDLESNLNAIVENNDKLNFLEKSSNDVIQEIIKKEYTQVNEQIKALKTLIPHKEEEIRRLTKDFENNKKKISNDYRPCKDELIKKERELQNKVNALTEDTYNNFILTEIGTDCNKLQFTIDDIIGKYSSKAYVHIEQLSTTFHKEKNRYDEFSNAIKSHTKNGLEVLKQKINNTSVKDIETGLKSLAKALKDVHIKIDAKTIKEISKWIKGYGGAAITGIGVAMDIGEKYSSNKRNNEFLIAKQNLANLISSAFISIYNQISDVDSYVKLVVPELNDLEISILNEEKEKKDDEQQISDLTIWLTRLKQSKFQTYL